MRKQRTEYDSPVDALIAITRSLSGYEDRYRISSEEFFDKFCKGQMEDSVDFGELKIEEKNNNDAGNRPDRLRFF